MRDEDYWKTDACRQKVVKKIYRSLSRLKTFKGNPHKESIRFENYLFNNAHSKEEYFSAFVRLVLQVREALHRQGDASWSDKPDRIDVLKDFDLPQSIVIPLLSTKGCVQSTLNSTPCYTPAQSQGEHFVEGRTMKYTPNILQNDLYLSSKSSVRGNIISQTEPLDGPARGNSSAIKVEEESSDDDSHSDDALQNSSQELFSGNEIDHSPKLPTQLQNPLSNNDNRDDWETESTLTQASETSINLTPYVVTAIKTEHPKIWVRRQKDLFSSRRSHSAIDATCSNASPNLIQDHQMSSNLSDSIETTFSPSTVPLNSVEPYASTNKLFSHIISNKREQHMQSPSAETTFSSATIPVGFLKPTSSANKLTSEIISTMRERDKQTEASCEHMLPASECGVNEAGPSTSQAILNRNQLSQNLLSDIAYKEDSNVVKEKVKSVKNPVSHSESDTSAPTSRHNVKMKRNKKPTKIYTSTQLMRSYYKKKLEIATFELKSMKTLHKLERAIKKKQLQKIT